MQSNINPGVWPFMKKNHHLFIDEPNRKIAIFPNDGKSISIAIEEIGVGAFVVINNNEVDEFFSMISAAMHQSISSEISANSLISKIKNIPTNGIGEEEDLK